MTVNLVHILKKTYVGIFDVIRRLVWVCQYAVVIGRVQRISTKPLGALQGKKCLFLVPHADDELVGCYKILKESRIQSTCYYFGFIGDGVKGESKEARKEEVVRSSRELRFHLIVGEGDPVEEIKHILESVSWDFICLPSFIDWHPDHLKVNDTLLQALNLIGHDAVVGKIITYQVSVPFPESYITHHSPLSRSEQSCKWELFSKVYRSQAYIPVARFMLNERISGALIGIFAAEVYAVYDSAEYQQILNQWMILDKSYLKAAINNICFVRQCVHDLLLKVNQGGV